MTDRGNRNVHKKLRRLAPIAEHLEGEWRDYYDSLTEIAAVPEHPEFLTWTSGGWVGDQSPQTAEQLLATEDDRIIETLRTWRPSGDILSPTKTGLARSLKAAVAKYPSRFIALSTDLSELDPEYVGGFFNGLNEAIVQAQSWDWDQLTDIALFVSSNAGDQDAESAGSWHWPLSELTRLLEAALDRDAVPYSIANASKIWKSVQHLVAVDDPPVILGETDLLTHAINSVNGKAIDTVRAYSRWINSAAGAESPTLPLEVRQLLIEQLSDDSARSEVIRASIGKWVPVWIALDAEWFAENTQLLFPPNTERLRNATWYGYIVAARPFHNVFQMLLGEYEHNVELLSSTVFDDQAEGIESGARKLAHHLMALLILGAAKPSPVEELTDRFFEIAPPQVRTEAIDYVGQVLGTEAAEFNESQLDRLKELWTSRVERAEQAESPEDFASEIRAFDGWFTSRRFNAEASLALFRRSVETAPSAERSWVRRDTIELLRDFVGEHPEDVIACLNSILMHDSDGWVLISSPEEVREILESVMEGSNATAARVARESVNRLISRGRSDFRDLI